MGLFSISVLDIGKEGKQGKVGFYITAVISYKNSFVVNSQPVTVSLSLGEWVACNTIFLWPFLQKINA